MLVVSETSPLTNLIAIDRLQLLSQLYDTVVVPEAVSEEITTNSAGDEAKKGLIAKSEFLDSTNKCNFYMEKRVFGVSF